MLEDTFESVEEEDMEEEAQEEVDKILFEVTQGLKLHNFNHSNYKNFLQCFGKTIPITSNV